MFMKNLFMGLLIVSVDQVLVGMIFIGISFFEVEMMVQIIGCQNFLLQNNMLCGVYDWVYLSGEFNMILQVLLVKYGFVWVCIVGGQWICLVVGDFCLMEMGGNGGVMFLGGLVVFIVYFDDIINCGFYGLLYLYNFLLFMMDSVILLVVDLQLVVDVLVQCVCDGKVELIIQMQIFVV